MRKPILIAFLLTIMMSVFSGPDHLLAGPKQESGLEAGAPSKVTSRQVVVYYFQRKFKCLSCEDVESTVIEALEEYFPTELNTGSVVWQMVNIDTLENRHYYNDYNLLSNSLVVVDRRNGEEQHYKILDNFWEIYRDRQSVFNLIRENVTACLIGD